MLLSGIPHCGLGLESALANSPKPPFSLGFAAVNASAGPSQSNKVIRELIGRVGKKEKKI